MLQKIRSKTSISGGMNNGDILHNSKNMGDSIHSNEMPSPHGAYDSKGNNNKSKFLNSQIQNKEKIS